MKQSVDIKNQTIQENDFLKLLIEQMKHQDPTSPQDSSQFMA